MKRIVNYIFLIVICLLPLMVDAKVNLEFNKEYIEDVFFFEYDGFYYFINGKSDRPDSPDALNIYDYNHNFIGNAPIFREDFESELDIYDYNPSFYYVNLIFERNQNNLIYRDDVKNIAYTIVYDEEIVTVVDLDTEEISEISFENDLKSSSSYLGRKYDVYLALKEKNYSVNYIKECDDVFIVNYFNQNGERYLGAFDSSGKVIVNYYYEDDYPLIVYAYDNLIYIMEEDTKLDIYKLDGEKIQTIYITNDKIEDFNTGSCTHLAPFIFNIVRNRLYITYGITDYGCELRMNFSDVADMAKQIGYEFEAITLEYEIDYDVKTVSSSNGEITYETKVDEDGESYVELKVVPKDGYSVEEIIVTDANGERIEVTNNKFYRPLNDVKVEVKYVKGEYLPIPDTFLGKSVSLIIIGLVLVSLGFYTINYVRQE